MTDSIKRVAVIGAGIIGVNCAAQLQSLGFNVTVFDKNGIGEGCSKGNAGHFATEQVFGLAEKSLLWQLPKLLLDPLGPVAISPRYFPKVLPWFLKFMANMSTRRAAQNSEAIKALNAPAIEQYRKVLAKANAEHLLTEKGSLLVFEKTSLKEVEKHYQKYRNAGVAVKLLSRQQVLLLEPNLTDTVQHALYFTEVGHTADPYDICLAIAEWGKSLGTEFVQQSVTDLKHSSSGVTLTTKENQYQFDHVVIATGAWSATLANRLGYQLPIEAERGYSLQLSATEQPELTRPVASAERRFIMTPMKNGLRLAGTAEFAGLHADANMKRASMLYKHADKLVKNIATQPQNSEDESHWMGCRPSLPDSLPVICQAPEHSNIFFALGHQHLGLTQGAFTGKLIGQLLSNEHTDIDLAPYCISRFN